MDSREDRIRDRAYHLWLAEGQVEGRRQDHWLRAEADIDGPAADAVMPLGPEAPQSGTEEQDVPPARLGKSERLEGPVQAGDGTNPLHHVGHLPVR